MTATAAPERPAPATRRARALLALLAVLGILGVGAGLVLGTRMLTAPVVAGGDAVGRPVDTAFGTFTVTRVRSTFVPDTQGPPSAAQHAGTNGSTQLQVWLRWVDTRGAGTPYDPTAVRLVPAGAKPLAPQGSTLTPGSLVRGAAIEGQVWFDLAGLDAAAARRGTLEVPDGAGGVLRVALTDLLIDDGHDGGH